MMPTLSFIRMSQLLSVVSVASKPGCVTRPGPIVRLVLA
jgi:hypothetical protein